MLNKDGSKKVEETTKENNPAPKENKPEETVEDTTQKTETEGKEEFSKDQIETWKKKAADFDGLVEKQRLAKLEKKKEDLDNEGKNSDAVLEEIKALREEIGLFKTERKKSSLSEAYKEFVKDYKWADNDEVFAKISENFNSDESLDKEGMLKNLKKAALLSYPDLYEKSIEEKIKSQSNVDKDVINTGGNAGGGSNMKEYVSDGQQPQFNAQEERLFNRFNSRRKARGEKPITPKEFVELSR